MDIPLIEKRMPSFWYSAFRSAPIVFIGFGIHALSHADGEDDETLQEKGTHGIFISTFLLITLAEFGDKTQIAVAGLGSTMDPLAVWLGATLALTATSGAGVVAGRTILQRIPISILHRLSGILFILLGVLALASLIW